MSRTGPSRGHPIITALLAAVAALAALSGCARGKSDADATPARDTAALRDRPNIVWLSIESVRADHVGCYGYGRDTTPILDKLAAEATVFDDAHSVTSWTLASHASMFTGLYPAAHRVTHPTDRLADDYVTIAEVLHDSGYQTAAVVAGPYLSKTYNLPQGFEILDDSSIQHMKGASADITNPDMEKALFKFLHTGRDSERPFMLFAYYWDTHSEYIPPAPYDTMFVPPGAAPIKNVQYMPAFKLGKYITQPQLDWLVAQYDGELRCTDEYIGRVFDLLRKLGLWENTMVIVTADHGEEFYDHGCNSHKVTLYEESVHVPLIIKWPKQTQPARDKRTVSLVDLYPTILDATGTRTKAPLNGKSLSDTTWGERPIFLELETLWSYHNKRTKESWIERKSWIAMRSGSYKLIHVTPLEDRAGEDMDPHWELYDLISDPKEQHSLAETAPETTGELQGQLAEWQEAMALLARSWETGGTAHLSPEEEARLRSLGYIP